MNNLPIEKDPINFFTCSINQLVFRSIKLLLCTVFCLTMIDISFVEAGEETSRVLFINSYNPGYSWSDDIEKGLVERFELSDRKVELSFEYLDSKRFTDRTLQNYQANLMQIKYTGFRHDLVITSDNTAFNFAIKYREDLFPDAPIVFCGYNSFRPDIRDKLSNITGVNEEMDITGLVEAALAIQPKAQTLVFILSTGDISSRILAEKTESAIIPKYQNQYEIVIVKDASMTQIREELARLPLESALFIVGQTSDMGEGRALTPAENGRLISDVSPVPAYTLWGFHLNTGVLGGRILTGYDQGKAAGDMALQILNGKSADSIPVLMKSPASNIFDYMVMNRFKIAMDALPDNSTVINKPYSFYEANKKIVWITFIAFATLIALIFTLSLNILRRRRAENELKKHHDHLEDLVKERTADLEKEIVVRKQKEEALEESEDRLTSFYNSAFEGIIIFEDGEIIDINNQFSKIVGYDRDELIGMDVVKLVVNEDREKVIERIQSNKEGPYEIKAVHKNGSIISVEAQGRDVHYHGRLARVSTVHDITERIKAEEEKSRLISELQDALEQVKQLKGLIPICANCKKIRDDKGYWNHLESYIEKHSDAQFSHGICQECAEALYGDTEWFKKNQNKEKI
jgi:PAS domain S-box-containing protein